MRVRNLQGFLEKAKRVHGQRYNYSKSAYLSATDVIEIVCSKHGSFWQRPANHLNGQGCPHCAIAINGKKKRSSTEEFIEKSRKVHGDTYGYLKVVYETKNIPVTISCKIHGAFSQKPTQHVRGNGCTKCRDLKSSARKSKDLDWFIEKARTIHGDKYVYDTSVYTGTRNTLSIECRKHGIFAQIAGEHLRGHGCISCAKFGFDQKKESILYVFTTDSLVKIGITNNNVNQRLSSLCLSSGLSFSVAKTYVGSGEFIKSLEKVCLQQLKEVFPQPDSKFMGYTETFITNKVSCVVELIEKNYEEL